MTEINWSEIEILVVEDSPTQALLIQRDLEERGCTVRTATNGQEGIEAIQKHSPDLVISDINMPKMDGYQMCCKLKLELKSNIPLILLSVLSDPMEVIKAIDCQADCFLTKPCHSDLLFSTMKDVLENQELLKEQNIKQKIKFFFKGELRFITTNPFQITNLLLSTYSTAIRKNTELEQANRELSLMQEKLKEKNENLNKLNFEKNILLGMAAHDLRNPLGIILGFSNLLLDSSSTNLDEKSRQKLEHIKKTSSSMLTMINDLLDISTIESGKVNLNLGQQDLVALTKQNLALNQGLADKKNMEIQFQAEGPIPSILCDSGKVEQILNNLITNAIKYSNRSTVILVKIWATDAEVILSVKDQGQGIPVQEQPNLFKSFSRTSVKTTGGEPSTGLGLAIVKNIVEAHKGRIWFESEVGKGSTFYVALPRS